MATDVADVVIVGGGCHGTSIAWQLARRGAGKIVLIEKSGIAAGATQWSSANVRLHYQIPALAKMALFGRDMFSNFSEVVGGDCGWNKLGFLVLVPEGEVKAAGRVIAMQQELGIEAEMISVDEIDQIQPGMNLDDVAAGCYESESGHADGTSTANAFAEAARRKGVDIRIGQEVTCVGKVNGNLVISTSAGDIEAPNVVLAAGYRTSELLAQLGVDLPLKPVRHTIAIVERSPGPGDAHPVVSDRVNLGYYRPTGPGLTLIGAHDPLEGVVDRQVEMSRRPTDEDSAALAERFTRRFPGQSEARLRPGYTGVYDCTPDFQPAIGPVQAVPGLFVAAGYSGHGFKLSPAVGKLMAEQIVDGSTTLADISMFRIERFEEDDLIRSEGGYESRTLA